MQNKKLKIVYMGSPEFAVPALKKLNELFSVEAVVTVPDKEQGRGKKVLPSLVKTTAIELGLPLFQPVKLKDPEFIDEIKRINPDIIVVIAFRILPEEVYSIPQIGSFNIHGSLLPKFRGAAPINHAIISGEKVTGLTSFLLNKTVDAGDILLQREMPIPENATFGDMYDKLMNISADLAVDTVEILISGNFTAKHQDISLATAAPKIFSNDCEINWNQAAIEVRNMIHGVSPVPGAWTSWNSNRLKIFRAELIKCNNKPAGSFHISKDGFIVNCRDAAIKLLEIQLPGKKIQNIQDFINGYRGDKDGIFEF
jgi:methionyl-tRNA formyltransferase